MRCLECDRELDNVPRHVKVHGLTYEAYALKHTYAGSRPTCKCGCGKETRWDVGKQDYVCYAHGHHMVGRKRDESTRRKIGAKNSENMRRYYVEHPDKGYEKCVQLRSGITEETEKRRIASTRRTYASMSSADKQKFSDHAKLQWQNNTEGMKVAKGKATATFKKRSAAGEYDFVSRNDKISQTVTQRYLDGGFEWSKGTYVSTKTGATCHYRSSWELTHMQRFDSDPLIVTWSYEPIVIPYKLSGKKKRYLPDFLVERSDGTRELIEVKPEGNLRLTPMNVAKRKAALAWCKRNNVMYEELSLLTTTI